MKSIKLHLFLGVTFVLVLLTLTLGDVALAQIPPPPMPSGPSQSPIDGGLLLVALGGAGYAIKKLRVRK